MFVYAIHNQKHKKLYIGQTSDLTFRLLAHNDGLFKNCFTSRFDGRWDLVYKEEVKDRKEALLREKQLKKLSRTAVY